MDQYEKRVRLGNPMPFSRLPSGSRPVIVTRWADREFWLLVIVESLARGALSYN